MLTKIIRKLLSINSGKLNAQNFYENIFNLSLAGMNIGRGGEILSSGEFSVIKYVKSKYHPNDKIVIFDVGANIGNYSRVLINEFDNYKYELHCFEPIKKNFNTLKENLPNKSTIRLHNFGLSNINCQQRIYYDHHESELASLYKRRLQHFGKKMKFSERILVKKIDDFCSQKAIDKINFLKLDIEGNELNALMGG